MNADRALELGRIACPNDAKDRTIYMLGLDRGYEEAESDLALKWEDVKRIINIADNLLAKESKTDDLVAEFQTEQSYYEEVLKRFKGGA